jgi:putative transposase
VVTSQQASRRIKNDTFEIIVAATGKGVDLSMFPPNRAGVTSRLRLRGHEYASSGSYFLTICINDHSQRLGTIVDDAFHPNDAGAMVERQLLSMPDRFPAALLDAYCLMPNHIHVIIGLGIDTTGAHPLPSIASIMDWFKSATTVEYIRGIKQHGWPRFNRRLWLDGYYDHVIRDDRDLSRIRSYIESNAANRQKDGFYTN